MFERLARKVTATGRHLVLLLDEAQDMTPETVHELRWLTNFNGGGAALLCNAALLAAGCASAPANFYTLSATATAVSPADAHYTVAVGPVRVPAEVDRRLCSAPNPATYWEDRIAEEYPKTRPMTSSADPEAAKKLGDLFGEGD